MSKQLADMIDSIARDAETLTIAEMYARYQQPWIAAGGDRYEFGDMARSCAGRTLRRSRSMHTAVRDAAIKSALKTYEAAIDSAQETRDAAIKPAWKAYRAAIKPALETRDSAIESAQKTCNEATKPAQETRDAAIESAWQEYASAQKTYDTTEETT